MSRLSASAAPFRPKGRTKGPTTWNIHATEFVPSFGSSAFTVPKVTLKKDENQSVETVEKKGIPAVIPQVNSSPAKLVSKEETITPIVDNSQMEEPTKTAVVETKEVVEPQPLDTDETNVDPSVDKPTLSTPAPSNTTISTQIEPSKTATSVATVAASAPASAPASASTSAPTSVPASVPASSPSSSSASPSSSSSLSWGTSAPISSEVDDAEAELARSIRKYERSFLLQFKSKFTERPEGLPSDLDEILDAANSRKQGANWKASGGRNQQRRGGAGGDRFPRSAGARGRNDSRKPNNKRRGQNQRQGGYNRRGPDQQMDIHIAPLEKSENRYQVAKEVEPDEKFIRNVTSILNKLTPEKFDILTEKILQLKIDNAGLLRDLVKAVFEKALAEPAFSPTYAKFCHKLTPKLPFFYEDPERKTQKQTFKRLILNTCQCEFEKPMPADQSTPDAAKAKKRMLGTIIFIGELFGFKIVSDNIMRHCIEILLRNEDQTANREENIEALNKLLATVGHNMDKDKNSKLFLDSTFAKLRIFSEDKEHFCSRIRFMCKDTIDLRKRRWVSLVKKATAKKISEIHKEKEQELAAQEKARKAADRRDNRLGYRDYEPRDRNPPRRTDRYSGFSNPSPKKRSKSPKGASGSWQTAKGKWSTKSQDFRQISRAAASPQKNRFSSAGRGRRAGDRAKVKVKATNAFAAFMDEDEDNESEKEENESEEDTKHEEDTKNEEDDVDEDGGRKVPDAVRTKTQSLLREYFSCEDLNEAKLCIEELPTEDKRDYSSVVSEGLLIAIDTKDRERTLLPKLMAFLSKDGILTSEHFIEGLDRVMAIANDLMMDAPRTLEHAGKFIGAILGAGCLDTPYIDSKGTECLGMNRNKLGRFFFLFIKENQSEEKCSEIFSQLDSELKASLAKEIDFRDVKELKFLTQS